MMVEFEMRDGAGEKVYVDADSVMAVTEYSRSPWSSTILMKDKTRFLVYGSPKEVSEKLFSE